MQRCVCEKHCPKVLNRLDSRDRREQVKGGEYRSKIIER
jgi:hypothetical protein